jgi:hypothetical protein
MLYRKRGLITNVGKDAREEETHVAELPPYPQPGMPRWVKVFGIIAIALVLLVVVIMLVSGGEHGPGRHLPGGETPGGHTPPVEHGP